MLCQVRGWLPGRALVGVGDSTYAALELLHRCQSLNQPITFITRLRLNAALYAHATRLIDIAVVNAVWFHNGLPPVPLRYLLIRNVAAQFDPQVLLSTDPALDAQLILAYFIRRWQMEIIQQVYNHLGVETQRQRSDKAILRSTFSDALALVQLRLWQALTFQMFASDPDVVQLPRKLVERFNEFLAYAA